MNKVVVILVMLLYLIPAVGVTVSVHRCDGKITSSSFYPLDMGHGCSCGSKKMKKDCCQDETASVRLDDDQQKRQFVFCSLTKLSKGQTAFLYNRVPNSQTPLLSTEFDYNRHPPDDIKHPLYLRHRVFQI